MIGNRSRAWWQHFSAAGVLLALASCSSESVQRQEPMDTDEPGAIQGELAVYIADFSGPYRRLLDLGLITMETNEYEYRFKDVVDLDSREVLFTVEHETRSQTNPMYGRELINRNPNQTNQDYKPGHDTLPWTLW